MQPMTGAPLSGVRGTRFGIGVAAVLLSMGGCRVQDAPPKPHVSVQPDAAVPAVQVSVREEGSVLTVRAGGQHWKWQGSTYLKLDEGPKTYYAGVSQDENDATVVHVIACARHADDTWVLPIRDKDLNYIRRLETIRRVPGGKLFVDCGVNPSLGVAIVVDLTTRTFTTYLGAGFVWNGDGSHVAYLRDPPHFGAPKTMRTRLFVDRTKLREFPRHNRYELVWKSAKVLAVIRHAAKSTKEVARIEVKGK